jgi:phenylalanyl-tRNA synthetase beta chain
LWIRRRLEVSGVRAINNVVDVTNYVMLEMGQPLHAFDFDRLAEKRIVVRSSFPGESFTTLDGVIRPVPGEGLLICDGRKPVALAGIMGGLNSEVEPTTSNILLESAYFEPMGIRRTSKKIGLATEASTRFEKGIDPNGSRWAALRASALMAKLSGGSAARGIVDNYPHPIAPKSIGLRASRVNQILGSLIKPIEINGYLKHLELVAKQGTDGSWQVTIPTFRVDLQREIDLIEEIARLHGFHKIPVTLPGGLSAPGKKDRTRLAIDQAKNSLVALGLREVINFSFIALKDLEDLKLLSEDPRRKFLRIQNPLSEGQAIMRTTLIPGLLQTSRANFYRQNMDLKIFETGRVFFPEEGQELPREVEFLSGLLTGLRQEESWTRPKEEVDFFDLKGILQAFLDGLRVRHCQFLPGKGPLFLHPGKASRLEKDGEVIGFLGEIHPDVQRSFELKQKVFVFELNFDRLVSRREEKRAFQPLPRFPAIQRDLAVVVDEDIAAGDLLRSLWEMNEGWITDINIFDLYQGNQIPPGKKSLAFRIRYQKEDRTLTDEEVNEWHQGMVHLLGQRYGAVLR